MSDKKTTPKEEAAECRRILAEFKPSSYRECTITTPVGILHKPFLETSMEETFPESKEALSDSTKKVNFQAILGLEKTEANKEWFNMYLSKLKECMKNSNHPNWGKKWEFVTKPVDSPHLPLLDGDFTQVEEFEDLYIIKAKIKAPYTHGRKTFNPLSMVDRESKNISPSTFYPGCFVRIKVSPYSWSFSGQVGISLGLLGIQFIRDGSRINYGSSVEPIEAYKEELDSVSLDSDDF